jgi:hypothetical protein
MVVVTGVIQARVALNALQHPFADTIGNYDRQVGDLRSDLPDRGVVGWITDQPGDLANFNIAQYGLAPLILARDIEHDFVVGKFVDPAVGREIRELLHLEPVRDYGDGLMLMRRREKE